jgi:hypothetical protein
MVRPPEYRQSKYTAKIDPDVIKDRITKEKDFMAEQTSSVFTNQEQFETQVGKMLNELGLYGIQLHHYRNFSQELFSLKRRFWNETLKKEATLLAKKWKSRGLEEDVLVKVAQFFGIELITPL